VDLELKLDAVRARLDAAHEEVGIFHATSQRTAHQLSRVSIARDATRRKVRQLVGAAIAALEFHIGSDAVPRKRDHDLLVDLKQFKADTEESMLTHTGRSMPLERADGR
jgi:hypothetical protein